MSEIYCAIWFSTLTSFFKINSTEPVELDLIPLCLMANKYGQRSLTSL